MKLKIYKSKDGWRFRLLALNGLILMSSEAYASKWSMMCTVKRISDEGIIKVYDAHGLYIGIWDSCQMRWSV